MKDKLREYRDKIINEMWDKYKGSLDMSEISEIFNLPLATVYRILANKKGDAKKTAENK